MTHEDALRKATKVVAHVGHTGTPDDFNRLVEALEWCRKHGHEFGKGDFIDLTHGRDFLSETKKYDVVVLHFIFRGGFGANNSEHPELGLSPLSSWSQWRKRLVASNAKLIFAFGGIAEVSGTFIVDLPGYHVHKIRTESMIDMSKSRIDGLWVFEKDNLIKTKSYANPISPASQK